MVNIERVVVGLWCGCVFVTGVTVEVVFKVSEGISVFVIFVSTVEGVVVGIGVGGPELCDGEGTALASEGTDACNFVFNEGCRWSWPFFSVAELFVVEGEIKESARS